MKYLKHPAVKEFIGEFIGTYILIFFGCGSIGASILFGAFDLFQVALIWGIAVALAIFVTRDLSGAHINPTVTFAFWANRNLRGSQLPRYLLGQFLGAFTAAASVYGLFSPAIARFELENQLIRGEEQSRLVASMFGEFYPNPGFQAFFDIGTVGAMTVEFMAAFLLVFIIYYLIKHEVNKDVGAVMIGITVSVLICIFAPFTQCGMNPARDLGPRLLAYFAGWEMAAFPEEFHAFFTVYILSPVLGGFAATFFFQLIDDEEG